MVLPIHVAGTLLAVAGTATAGVFYLIARRLYSRTASLCVLFFFAVSHYFVATDVNGLETALYGLTLSGTLYCYLMWFVHQASSTRFRGAILGFLAALAVLARVDAIIFVACIVLHYLWHRRDAVRRAMSPLTAGMAAFVVTLAPWVVANLALCGTVVPDSGPAVRFIAVQNGWRPVTNLIGHTGPECFTEHEIPTSYYANNLLRLGCQLVAFLPMTAHAQGFEASYLFNKMERFPVGRLVARAPRIVLAAMVALALAALLAPGMRRRRLRERRGLQSIAFLGWAVVAWVLAYGLYVLCPWHSHRYVYPALALLTLGSGAVADVLFTRGLREHLTLRRAVLSIGAVMYAFLFVNQTGHYYTAHRSRGLEPDRYTPVLPWLQENLPPSTVFACFQSGVLSYFTARPCVNLDGVVNREALAAARDRRLWAYLLSEDVAYVVDWPICIERNLIPYAGVPRVPIEKVHDAHGMDVFAVRESAPVASRPRASGLEDPPPAW
jgi:hypothetical protein